MQYVPLLCIIMPVFSAALLVICSCKKEIFRKIIANGGCLITFAAVVSMTWGLKSGGRLGGEISHLASPLIFSFSADLLSYFFALIFSFIFLVVMIYSWGYMKQSHAQIRYFSLLLILESTMLGVVLSSSLVGLFVFFEAMTIAAYLLIIHEEDEMAMFAGAKFLFMTIVAGLAIFFGLVVLQHLAGRLDFLPGGYIEPSSLAMYGLLAFFLGFGIKAGMFPVHIWLPDAHPTAPAPVSAILSGCSIKLGAYGMIRIIYDVFGVETVRALSFDRLLMMLAVATILIGSALALQQDHLKRRLAYSSVTQIGYIILGISLLNSYALFGALFHIFTHAIMKSGLFLCAGAIITQTGKKYISQLSGIGYQMPVVMLSFTVFAMTIVGLPPFIAFTSKWHLAAGALDSGMPILVFLLILSSMLNALYYFPIAIRAFLGPSVISSRNLVMDELPRGMLWTTALLAVLCVVFAFIQPNWPVIMAGRIAASIF